MQRGGGVVLKNMQLTVTKHELKNISDFKRVKVMWQFKDMIVQG
jgi:hypothetical protein